MTVALTARRSHRMVALLVIVTIVCAQLIGHASPAHAGDRYLVTLAESLVDEPVSGRLVVCFIEGEPRPDLQPVFAPFIGNPQPMAGVDVENLEPGGEIVIDGSMFAFPDSLDLLDGQYEVQAVFDRNTTDRAYNFSPGNLLSEPMRIVVRADDDDTIRIRLTSEVPEQAPPALPNLRFIACESDQLSTFHGEPVMHRAAVALPAGYDLPECADRLWPVIYVVPSFGTRVESGFNYAQMLSVVESEFVPQAVWIVLDAESPLGHHGFCDSANNGPRATALVKEFIPHLESQFRLDPRPDARLLYGHGSGGWSVLWLQLMHPETFGATWASAPDPVDFSRFRACNLYNDRNVYTFALHNETPSYRTVDFDGRDQVHATVRQENLMEHAIDATGRSGEQWDSWQAMWSPRDESTGLPAPLFDPLTGTLDPLIVSAWSAFDIRRLAIQRWDEFGPIFDQRIRVFCGEHDNFYLDRAVENLKVLVDGRLDLLDARGPGYIEIIEYAAHGSIVNLFTERMHREMIEYIDAHAGDLP